MIRCSYKTIFLYDIAQIKIGLFGYKSGQPQFLTYGSFNQKPQSPRKND